MFDSPTFFYFYAAFIVVIALGGVLAHFISRSKKEGQLLSALGYVLYEITFSGEEKKTEGQNLKELISVM